MCLRAGIEDAKMIAPYFSRIQLKEEVDRTVEDIINLDPYHALVKTSTKKESCPLVDLHGKVTIGQISHICNLSKKEAKNA